MYISLVNTVNPRSLNFFMFVETMLYCKRGRVRLTLASMESDWAKRGGRDLS